MTKIPADKRRLLLRAMLKQKDFIRTIEAVNGIEAIIAENAGFCDENGDLKAFDALWLSGFTHAAFKGKADNGIFDINDKISAIKDIFAVSSKPILVDMDNGGTPDDLCQNAAMLEALGVSAIVVEDKTGPKNNSLYGAEKSHIMEDADIFSDKIRIVKASLATDDFMVFARIESLIAGEDIEKALLRAKKYLSAGADGIVIHSINPTAKDIFEFAKAFKDCHFDIPLIFIPTAYNSFTDTYLHQMGADIIIYANQLMRSAYCAMQKTAMSILQNGSSLFADENYCTAPKTILNLIDGEQQ